MALQIALLLNACSHISFPGAASPHAAFVCGGFSANTFSQNAFSHSTFSHNPKEKFSMNPTTIRIIAGVLFVIIVTIIVWRRKNMASKRKHVL